MINIKQFLNSLDNFYDKSEIYEINGWVRTLQHLVMNYHFVILMMVVM